MRHAFHHVSLQIIRQLTASSIVGLILPRRVRATLLWGKAGHRRSQILGWPVKFVSPRKRCKCPVLRTSTGRQSRDLVVVFCFVRMTDEKTHPQHHRARKPCSVGCPITSPGALVLWREKTLRQGQLESPTLDFSL